MFKKWIVNTAGWITAFIVFLLTFFLFFSETQEFFNCLIAAILAAVLVLGVWVVVTWIIQVFKRS
jgi:hypothetical protein